MKETEWINCEDKNPPEEFLAEPYLVSDGDCIKIGYYAGKGDWWGEIGDDTKYWKDLPSLPT